MARAGLAAAAAAGLTPQPGAFQPKPAQSYQPPAGAARPYGTGSAQPAGQTETVVFCPPNLVGRVIGRGGETINNLQVSILALTEDYKLIGVAMCNSRIYVCSEIQLYS